MSPSLGPRRIRLALAVAATCALLSGAAWTWLWLARFNDSIGMSGRSQWLFENLHPVRHLILTNAVPMFGGLALANLGVAIAMAVRRRLRARAQASASSR